MGPPRRAVHAQRRRDVSDLDARAGAFSWATDEGTFTSSPMTADEVFALKWEHGIIDDALVRQVFRCERAPRLKSTIVRRLFALGWPVEAIEDYFDLTTAEVHGLTRPLRERAVRFLYRAGMPTRDIAERLEVDLTFISRVTRDMCRAPRIGTGRVVELKRRRTAVPGPKVEEAQRRWAAGECRRAIARDLGVSANTVYKYTRAIPRTHVRCDLCSPGPKQKACSTKPVTAPSTDPDNP